MKTHLLASAAIMLMLPGMAFSAEEGTVQSEAIPDALINLIDAMPDAADVASIATFDMSRNGTVEGLVVIGSDCEKSSCEWRLFAEGETGWRAVGSGVAVDPYFEPLADGGAVVNSDGITWAYSGGDAIYMWGDLLQDADFESASDADYVLIGARTEYTSTPRIDLGKYTIDLNGDGSYVAADDYQLTLVGTGVDDTLVYNAATDVFTFTVV